MPACFSYPTALLASVLCLTLLSGQSASSANSPLSGAGLFQPSAEDQAIADRVIHSAEQSKVAFHRLSELCDTFGPRLSGSTNLEAAIDWVIGQMKADGFENVHGEEVMVPHWVRGAEAAELLQPVPRSLPMAGLGGSVGTLPDGITAPVLVVRTFDELAQHRPQAAGKIVLFNAPFVSYGETVAYRSRSAVEAAKAGAVACLVRSVTPFSLQTPHTGALGYQDGVIRIPAAAVTIEDAEQLQRWQERGRDISIHLKMSAMTLPDARSHNVVAELPGREHPNEIVIVSGHLDSWDISPGAQDDGGGVIAAWEALRLLRELGLRPRRTIRLVLWTNEENGMRGVKNYAERHRQELAKHVLAIESDEGTFQPTGFTFKGNPVADAAIKKIGSLLRGIQADRITAEGGGSDVAVLAQFGVPQMELTVEGSKYFWYHHTASDTPDKVNPQELARCAAAMAVMAYEVANLPEGQFPR